MSLRGVLKKVAKTVFKSFGDVPEIATYRRKTIDYSTGEVVETNIDVVVQGVFTRFEVVEIDKLVVQNSDVKMIVRVGDGVNELPYPPNPATDVVVRGGTPQYETWDSGLNWDDPTLNWDAVSSNGGKQFNVINYKTEPSETIYIVQLRAT